MLPTGPRHFLAPAGAPPLFLTPGKLFTIGRAPECSFSVPSKRVSRLHAEISWVSDKPLITDKDSSNGVFVNGARIKSVALQPGDELEIGPFLCVYRFGDPSAVKADSAEVSKTMADKGDVLGGQITEVGLTEVLQGLEFNAKTGTLNVFSREVSGWLTILSGSPGASEANEKRDEEAILELLLLKQGRFTFTSELRTPEKRIKATVTALLLEWGRRADEREGAAAAAAASMNPGATATLEAVSAEPSSDVTTEEPAPAATAIFKHVEAELGTSPDLGSVKEADTDTATDSVATATERTDAPSSAEPSGTPASEAPAGDSPREGKAPGFDFPS